MIYELFGIKAELYKLLRGTKVLGARVFIKSKKKLTAKVVTRKEFKRVMLTHTRNEATVREEVKLTR